MPIGAVNSSVETAGAVKRGTTEASEYERKGRVARNEEKRSGSEDAGPRTDAVGYNEHGRVAAETTRRRDAAPERPEETPRRGRDERKGRLVNVRG